MKHDWKQIVRDFQCSFGWHDWQRTSAGFAYQAGFHTRGCKHCPAEQVYASELGSWVDNQQ